MAKSVKVNYILSLIETSLNVAFPLITFPYVTRILSPDSIGHVHFYLNIISYVILFVGFGIPLYGVREISKVRNNKEIRNSVALEILTLHITLTILGYLLILFLCFNVPQISQDAGLFSLLSLSVLFTTIGVQWFFQAVEDFTFITIRSLVIKIISLLLLFSIVKTEKDVFNYGVVLLCGTAGNNLFNLFRLRKYISLSDFKKELHPFRHIRPAFRVFILNITIGVYTQMSVFLLGFLQSEAAVGYYSMAQKIVDVINTIVLSLATVLLPRLANYSGNEQYAEFKQLGDKALSFVLAISLPICVGMALLAKPIIMVLFGETYNPSVSVLMIWAPIIVSIGLSQVYGKDILYSLGHETLMTKCTFVGMVVFLVVGVPAIMHFSIVGAALASFFAETAVTGCMMLFGKKWHSCTIMRRDNLAYVLASLIMGSAVYISTISFNTYLLKLLVGVSIGPIVYFGVLGIMHNSIFNEVLQFVKIKKQNKYYE